MTVCSFCQENEKEEYWGDGLCVTCKDIKNISKVYSFQKSLDVLRKVCLRNETQLDNNVKRELEKK
tara:strand:- start:207 stop:404 length:198 start_codon:yes stop_codon:yes gene_type:complete